jgi:hypothetical protein
MGTDTPRIDSYTAPELDSWDRWNYSRGDQLMESLSARYVLVGVYGVNDLDHFGSWRTFADYGPVWFPSRVEAGWSPYARGNWVWDSLYGWSWVDDEPWGWAPCHYGRWVSLNGYWGWAPGPSSTVPFYAPALVGFVDVPEGLGWVPLSWGEPLIPWWGPASFRHAPTWRGWGGPRVINETVIHETTINETTINNIVYRNAKTPNAVLTVRTADFGRGQSAFVRLASPEVRQLHPHVQGITVTPTAKQFSPTTAVAVQPPKDVLARPLLATRAPTARAPLGNVMAGMPTESKIRPAMRLVTASPATEPGQRQQSETLPPHNTTTPTAVVGAERHLPPPPPHFDAAWQQREKNVALGRTPEPELGQNTHSPSLPPTRVMPGGPGDVPREGMTPRPAVVRPPAVAAVPAPSPVQKHLPSELPPPHPPRAVGAPPAEPHGMMTTPRREFPGEPAFRTRPLPPMKPPMVHTPRPAPVRPLERTPPQSIARPGPQGNRSRGNVSQRNT